MMWIVDDELSAAGYRKVPPHAVACQPLDIGTASFGTTTATITCHLRSYLSLSIGSLLRVIPHTPV
jgi:hypothetical protein